MLALVLALALSGPPPAASRVSDGAPDARGAPVRPVALARLERGRASLVGPAGLAELNPSRASLDVCAPLYVETGPDSELDLCIDGRASLGVRGSAELEWLESERLEWALAEADELFLELRRGSARLHLPAGWQLELAPGAFYVRGGARGDFEIHVDAAGPLRVEVPSEARFPRPPLVLSAGSRVRLGAGRSVQVVAGAEHVWRDPRSLLAPGSSARREEPGSEWLAAPLPFAWPWGASAGAGSGARAPRATETGEPQQG